MHIEKAPSLLLDIISLMESDSIPYWVDSGLLLSLYRDKSISSHIKKLTLSISSEFYRQTVKTIKHQRKYTVVEIPDKSGFDWIQNPISRIVISSKFGKMPKLEIMVKERHGEYFRWVGGLTCKEVPFQFYDQLDEITLDGQRYHIPVNIDQYLAYRYDDWQKPKNDWDTNFDDGARLTLEKIQQLNRKSRITKDSRYKKNKLEGSILKQTESVLSEITRFLYQNDIRYWLDFGTLLGIYRDQQLIPWDNDADISIHGDDVEKLNNIKTKLPHKYRLSIRYNRSRWLPGHFRVFKLKIWYQKYRRLFNRKELHIDIFVKYKKDDYYYWIGSGSPKRVAAYYHDTLQILRWKSEKYSIPNDVGNYLKELYGDWQTPRKIFDSSIEEKTLCDTIQYKTTS